MDTIKSKTPFANVVSIMDGFSIFIFICVLLSNLWLFIRIDPYIWVDQISDDCYYYLGIARNLAEHGLFQFMPPLETNGFQPLWLVVLSATAWLFGSAKIAVVVECWLLSCALILGFLALAWRRQGTVVPAIIVTFLYSDVMLEGMETVMLPAVFLLFMAASDWKSRGLFGSLLFLTRLDAISVVVARDLYSLLARRKIDARPYLIIIPVVLIYGALNYAKFGLAVPVSGLSKSLGMVIFENWHVSLQYLISTLAAISILLIIFGYTKLLVKAKFNLRYPEELTVCAIAILVCAAYYGALSGWPVWGWYFWAPMLLTFYVLAEAVEIVRRDLSKGLYVRIAGMALAIAAVIVLSGGLGYMSNTVRLLQQALGTPPATGVHARQNLQLVQWVKSAGLPKDTYFAMGDRSGSVGYFLGEDYRMLQTEGLVASGAYYAALKLNQGLPYIESLGLNYWIAAREQFMQSGDIIGVIEPVQGLSMHQGVYVICFAKTSIVRDQSYVSAYSADKTGFAHLYVFDMKGHTVCPADLQTQFEGLRANYGKVRAFSLPLETAVNGLINPYVKKILNY